MLWLYNLGIQFFSVIVSIFSLFNNKAKHFVKGRINIFTSIADKIDPSKKSVWFHFASLGEFEQGRPVLEALKAQYPAKNVVVTFFSPSGYEIRKNYPLAEGVFYLPLDTANNAARFISAINPEMAIFTKYEYWYHYFKTLHKNNIPLFVISGIFRPNQIFFKWYGSLNRKILSFVDHFFVQNEESKDLLKSIGLQNVILSGDTRFDRVAENADTPKSFPLVKQFCQQAPVLVAGSTWPEDEQLLKHLISAHPEWKFIIAPHEIDETHISNIQNLVPGSITYSNLNNLDAQVLIIDNIGLLSSLYQYGKVAYIGGGFGAGIHNTLEAAAYGMPVIFGPKYQKFQEAKDLIQIGAALSINNADELNTAFEQFKENKKPSESAKAYVTSKKGATAQIISYLSKYF